MEMNLLPLSLDHFLQLEKRNPKGYTTFRCIYCQHTFRCAGKRRLLQHILGRDYRLGKDRNIIPCPNPNLTIKSKILSDILSTSEERTDDSSSTSSSVSSSSPSAVSMPSVSLSSSFSSSLLVPSTSVTSASSPVFNFPEVQKEKRTKKRKLQQQQQLQNEGFDSEMMKLIEDISQQEDHQSSFDFTVASAVIANNIFNNNTNHFPVQEIMGPPLMPPQYLSTTNIDANTRQTSFPHSTTANSTPPFTMSSLPFPLRPPSILIPPSPSSLSDIASNSRATNSQSAGQLEFQH